MTTLRLTFIEQIQLSKTKAKCRHATIVYTNV